MKISAQKRTETGTTASKRARNEGKLPGAIYGSNVETIPVLLNDKEFHDTLREVGYNGVFEVEVEGDQTYQVFVKETDRAALKPLTYHVDLLAFAKGEKVAMTIPVVITGAEEIEEGIASQSINELEVEADPSEVPSEFTVDVSELVIGDSLTVANIDVPESVEVLTDASYSVVSIVPPEEEIEETGTEEDAEMPEPEVIGEAEEDEEDEE